MSLKLCPSSTTSFRHRFCFSTSPDGDGRTQYSGIAIDRNSNDNEDDMRDSRDPKNIDPDSVLTTLAVLEGEKSLAEDDMPFVNRHEELFQVFLVNAKNINRIINKDGVFKNFRPLNLLFCVQYFGSGKTTLGEQFPQKVETDNDFQAFVRKKLVKRENRWLDYSHLEPEWQYLQQNKLGRLRIDVADVKNILLEAATVAAEGKSVGIDPSAKNVARLLVSYARRHGPTLFHFDEVGAYEEHSLKELRSLARSVWTEMWTIKNTEGADAMPRVYFLVTGKSTGPFRDIGKGSSDSPCGSHFLVLDMLSAKYVGDIRRHMMEHNLNLNDLKDEDENYLDDCLAGATGGAPRLLLYALRALHYLQPPLGSRKEIDEAINVAVYKLLVGIDDVKAEFLPSSTNAIEKDCFRLLLSFCLQGVPLDLATSVKVGKENMTVAQMLRFQPFYLSRSHVAGDKFILRIPLYHLKAAETDFDERPASMLLLAMAGTAVSVNEPWRIFEMLPAHIVASRAELRSRLSSQRGPGDSWADVLPSLFGGSCIAKEAVFRLGDRPYLVSFQKDLPEIIEKDPVQYAQMGGVALPPDKSKSADLFHVQYQKSGPGTVIFEWQQKLYTGLGFSMSDLRDEVKKVNKSLRTVLTVFSTKIGAQLQGAMGDNGVLILQPWSDAKEAEFSFSSVNEKSPLLWRESGSSQWFRYPSKQERFSGGEVNNTVVCVRPHLEVVIPHHDVIRELVGHRLFDRICDACKRHDRAGGFGGNTMGDDVIVALDDVISSPSQADNKLTPAPPALKRKGLRKGFTERVQELDADVGIRQFFQALELEMYADAFEREAITMDELVTMDESELQQVCGVQIFGHRRRIRRAAEEFARNNAMLLR